MKYSPYILLVLALGFVIYAQAAQIQEKLPADKIKVIKLCGYALGVAAIIAATIFQI
jgi:hypothetical protein